MAQSSGGRGVQRPGARELRGILVLGGASVLGAALVGCGCGDDTVTGGAGGTGGAGACVHLADGRCVEETFHNPPVLEPNADGVYELELKPTEFEVDGKRQCGRGYNGQYPAPTIDTAANDGTARKVRVNLKNGFTKSDYQSLSEEACTCTDVDTGETCTPAHHGDTQCICTTASGDECHVFDFNVTNLHAHGSHVRPDYATGGGCVEEGGLRCRSCSGDAQPGPHDCFFADDVISRVNPGEGVQHRWDIDEDGIHHAGLDWYHPHIHGSTAIQVAGGATGAWIIRGALDEIPGIKNAKERVMLLTTPPIGYEPLADGEPCDEDHITFDDFAVLGDTAEKQTNLINGIRRPRIVMPPGQIERWRILHGAFLDEVALALFHSRDSDCQDLDLTKPPVGLTQIGRDGVPLTKPASGEGWPFKPPYIFMAPGYRIEALLDGSELSHGDTLCLMAGRFLQEDTTGTTSEPVGITQLPTPEDILQAASNGDVIAIVNVSNDAGTPTETNMPDLDLVSAESPSMMLQDGTYDALARCEEVKTITQPEEIDELSMMWPVFYNTEGFDACSCKDHNLNCKNFEDTNRDLYPYDRVFVKGAVEHWRLYSGFDGHPFHIHINPFIVCPLPPEGSPDPATKSRLFEPPFAHWRDTYLVNLDRVVDAITEYRGFTGNFVYHCHKLNHEDHGMMELVHVCDPAVESCDTLCSGGPCNWHTCAPGDDNCLRQLKLTECLLDPTQCPEALVRCTQCGDAGETCPPEAHCSDVAQDDGELRCAPGCLTDTDCAVTDACDTSAGDCLPAPCAPPCGPGQMCVHGACMN
ncbi:MAG: multicopper oxidase domain-containing protein [Polyangiaceae bacterium]